MERSLLCRDLGNQQISGSSLAGPQPGAAVMRSPKTLGQLSQDDAAWGYLRDVFLRKNCSRLSIRCLTEFPASPTFADPALASRRRRKLFRFRCSKVKIPGMMLRRSRYVFRQ